MITKAGAGRHNPGTPRFGVRHAQGEINGLRVLVGTGGIRQAASVPHAGSRAVATANVVMDYVPRAEWPVLFRELEPVLARIDLAADHHDIELAPGFRALMRMLETLKPW